MPALSKLAYFLGLPVLNANCYETFHTWSPNCNQAILDALPDGMLFSLKTYAPLYLITALISNQGDFRRIEWKRHAIGFFTPITMGLVGGLFGSFLSLLIEKRNRWPSLALYLTNLASETFFRHLSNRGYVRKISKGEVIPFAIGVGLFSYLYSAEKLDENTRKVFNFVYNATGAKHICLRWPLPEGLRLLLDQLRTKFGRAELCEHRHSCVSVVVESFIGNYATGLGASVILTILRNILFLASNPMRIMKQLFSRSTLRIPIFFGLMLFVFHGVRCVLTRICVSSHTARNVTAGIASGLAMLAFPNVSIAMYVISKAIEAMYYDLFEQGRIRPIPYGDLLLYTISTAFVLWRIVIEPQAIRKSYFKFILSLTGNRMALLNRDLYKHFGNQSHLLFPYRPTLNNKYVTINPMLYQPISGLER
uniref:TMEM135_C_rich domain-containing protein n=1 Tax=Angiostrongylus cantonensis TaxID=6313 RepID=A0A0K0D0B3_ANGCA